MPGERNKWGCFTESTWAYGYRGSGLSHPRTDYELSPGTHERTVTLRGGKRAIIHLDLEWERERKANLAYNQGRPQIETTP